METTIIVILITLLVGGVILLFRKWPQAQEHFWFFKWALETIAFSLDYWGFKNRYSNSVVLASRFTMLLQSKEVQSGDLRDVRKQVSEFVDATYAHFGSRGPLKPEERRASVAAYVALINHREILELATALVGRDDIDVRQATLLCIDVLGELIDLSDDLGQDYFQHLIYGINKCLIIIRDEGTNKKSLKKVSTTLFRVYKLSKAYRRRRSLEDLTQEEFHAKISSYFNVLFRIFGV